MRANMQAAKLGYASAPAPAPELRLPNPTLAQTNPPFKKATEMKWGDANFSPVRIFLFLH